MKIYIIAAVVIICSVFIFFIYYQFYSTVPRVCFDETCFSVEIADNDAERTRGLMNRSSLAETSGMLFIFEEERIYPFWMKDTLIPLDIIWIDSNKKVVFINNETPPCEQDPCPSYNPRVDALYVVEIPGGVARTHDIQVGRLAEFYSI